MRLVTTGVALALSAATFTACQPAATAPPQGRHAVWAVKDTETSRDGTINSYAVICANTAAGTTYAWREITVSETAEYALDSGDPCPAGPVIDSASCRTDGTAYDLHPDTAVMQAKAPLICTD